MKTPVIFYLSLFTIFYFGYTPLWAQPAAIRITYGCNFDQRAEEREYFTNTPSTEAEDILEELCIALGIDRSSITLKSANVTNAVATRIGNERYILYSSEFLSRAKISAQSRWAVCSILAHEIGHHILGHNFEIKDPSLRKLLELEADRFSGRMLRNLCAKEPDALLAMHTLSDEPKAGYPILSARRDAISSGWVQQNQDLKSNGRRDPCVETIFEPQFGRQYKKFNLARDVRAIVGEESMRFQFNAQGRPGRSEYGTFIVVPPNSSLSPKYLEWITPANSTGNQRELIWHFGRQGLSKEQIMLPDKLGIAVFEKRHKPEAVHWLEFAYPGLAMATGGMAMALGYSDIKAADDLYNNPYSQIRNDNDPVYLGDNPRRPELLNMINEQSMRGQGFRNAGIGLVLGGAVMLWRQWRGHERSRIGLLYNGQGGIGIRITPQDANRKFY